MDQLKEMKQDEERKRPGIRFVDTSKSVRSRGVGSYSRWEPQPDKPAPSQLHDNSGDDSEPHEPKVVQLNLKSSLMGVQILDDDEEIFFSRQSSMSSMLSDKFRSSGAVPFKWEAEAGKPIGQPKAKIDIPSSPLMLPPSRRGPSGVVPFKWESGSGKPVEKPKAKIDIPSSPLMLPPSSRGHSGLISQPFSAFNSGYPQPSAPGSRGNSGLLFTQPLSAFNSGNTQPSARSTRIPSGLLYPCPNPGSRPNSCQLNAAVFTFENNLLTPDHQAGTSGGNNVTERIFKKLVGQSRLHQCNSKGADSSGNLDSRSDFNTGGDDLSDSPVSTLDVPQSPTSSERSFRGKSKRKSLRRRSEDANTIAAAQVGPIDPTTPRPKSQLAQYLMSITALTEDATDDDDLEGPSEVAWLEPDDNPYHPELPVVEGYMSAHGKKNPTHERWSSNSSSWNLSLVQKPLKTVSTIVSRRQHQHATIPGRSAKKGARRGKVDAIMPISLTMSYDGGTIRSKTVRKGTRSELDSGRSWWPDLGSGRKSTVWACSGRLQMEVAAEPDLHEPDMEQANNVKNRQQQGARAKVDEEDFPFENPIASSFVFQEAAKSQSSADAREKSDSRASLHKSVISVIDSENDELLFSDNYHDPEDGSFSDSDGSHTLSLEREGPNGLLDQPPQWVPTRSFDYVRDMVDIGLSGRALSGLSGSVLSGFVEMGRSGRFSVDLQRGQKLDKVQHPRTPDVRLRMFKSEKSSKRSILSPCLPFLHRSHNKHVPRIQRAPAAGACSRRLQPVNSFTARLGPVAESTLAGQFQLQ